MPKSKFLAWIGFLIWIAALVLLYYGYNWTSLAVNLIVAGFAFWSIAITKGWIK